jgi:hypothetical protein
MKDLLAMVARQVINSHKFDDEDSDSPDLAEVLPDESCGSIVTPAEKSAPKIGERSRENESAPLVRPDALDIDTGSGILVNLQGGAR